MDIKEPREDRRKDPIPGEYGYPIPKELFYRELGFSGIYAFHNFPRHNVGKKLVSQNLATKAVHTLCTKELTRRRFKLPNGARTTFHIAFSADGTKVASCHGDHNVYVCDVASGEVVQTLSGHPRTPWCVVFHPSQNDILASGCLQGHVRVWDLKGGSELLVTDSGTVIASLAFHPTVRLLAIATFNEIIFWDWGHPYPLARCSTENTKEKVRLVRFDSLGRSLITGITNFPSPPAREEVRRPVRNGGPLFRPNILSRNYRNRRAAQIFPSNSRDDIDNVEDVSMVHENEVVEEVVVPDPEESEAEAYAVAAAAVAADLGEVNNERFNVSYRQLVSHYEELVSNYQQFLRSRIPRILENSNPVSNRPSLGSLSLNDAVAAADALEPQLNADVIDNQMEDNFEHDPLAGTNSVSESVEVEPSSTTTLESPASPVVMDDEIPGPSRLIFESTRERAIDVPEENILTSTVRGGTRSPPGDSSNSSTRSGAARSDTDLRSIEALAQNILEMQNLCSQVRMDAPLAAENQHIMELRVIRRHLELLQEQTRELQSSIRATLNSLATGSLAALRSHVANAANSTSNNQDNRESLTTSFPNLEQATPPTPVGPGPSMDFEPVSPPPPVSRAGSQRDDAPVSVSSDFPRRVRIEATIRSGNGTVPGSGNGSNNHSGPSTIYRIMMATPFSESGRLPNTPLLNRIRVPPMVAMQYEGADSGYSSYSRNQPGPSRNSEDPVAAPSRDAPSNGSSNNGNGRGRDGPGPRRIVREYHLVSGRPGTYVAEEHARHCPFSGRDPWRPPPRMRSLYDMGEMPPLVPWPTNETGLETSIRNFGGILQANLNRSARNPISGITITVRNGLVPSSSAANESSLNNNTIRSAPFMNFGQWLFGSGMNTLLSAQITNDLLVGVYLTLRQINIGNSNGRENNSLAEFWQQPFGQIVPGLALIPPITRQGQRVNQPSHRCQHRRRRTQWVCYNHNSPPSRPGSTSVPITRSHIITLNTTPTNTSSNTHHASSTQGRSAAATASSNSTTSTRTTSHRSNNHSNRDNAPDDTASTAIDNSSQPVAKQSAPVPIQPIPPQLEGNFNRVFYIRAAEELIPVYSTGTSSETAVGNEARESLQGSVYYLPVGLFLQGGPWETNTQTLGIYWPPVTREEEYAILDIRVSERPLAICETDTRESFPNNRQYPRIRLDYDQTSLRVTLPNGFGLVCIHPGLALLDCISNTATLPRPRPRSGTLWIDYLGPFLDALERMFGLRHSRRTLGPIPSAHRIGAFISGRSPPWIQPPGTTSASARSSSTQQPSTSGNQGGSLANRTSIGGIPIYPSRRVDVGERLRTMTRRVITLAPDAPVDPRRRYYEDNPMILSHHGFMYENALGSSSNGGNGSYRSFFERGGPGDRRFYFRHRHRHDANQHSSSSASSGQGHGNDGPRDGSDGGRFIRLAVDTAASEVLRRNYQHHSDGASDAANGLPVVEAGSASGFSSIGRPVESRIERVLNERGNRGAHSPSPTGMLEESSRNRMRLEEIQMRISMLSQWSRARAMATSGTQTPHSYVRASWPNSSDRPATVSQATQSSSSERDRNRGADRSEQQRQALNLSGPSASNSNGNEHRVSRRRPYSRMARLLPADTDDTSEEDLFVSVPPRIPRLNDSNHERSSRSESHSYRSGLSRNSVDQWVLRTLQTSQNDQRYSSARDLPGSARTRATHQNRFPAEIDVGSTNNESEPVRPRFHRASRNGTAAGGTNNAGGSNPPVNNDGNNNSVPNGGGDDQSMEGSPRFYPGYIPEILITPRTRPATYYTMDAATTAFLSSRIQKWDFSEFLIPDITKRDESVVVRECSLHSDACLDVSADCEFLAVLQPSDSGAYSSVGIYSLRDESLGEILNVYHFDQNTVSVSISPSCDYLVVGYAGRGPLYRFVSPSRNIGKILSLTRDEDGFKLVPVKDLYADGQVAFMSINCMHWVPVAGYGIVYGTNTGDLVLLS